jgi:two-component system OmpR family sensor kinase
MWRRRRTLQRRLFRWFGGAIASTAITLGLVAWAFGIHPDMAHDVGWPTLFGVALGAIVLLWTASGRVAHRLGRPLQELADVAKRLGDGDLTARASAPRRAPDEVGEVARALNDMAGRVERQLDDHRELLAVVSHELRTPLQRIRLLVEIARDTGATDAMFDGLDREVIELDALVGELLTGARLDAAPPQKVALDAAAVAVDAAERLGLPAEVVVVEGEPSELSFAADPVLVHRALANLVKNAEKHAGGVVRLRVHARPGVVVFDVEDAGGGLAPGEEDRIFTPFYHRARPGGGDASSTAAMSLGLGLALVKRIAVAHGGQVYAQNRSGGGALVGIELAR